MEKKLQELKLRLAEIYDLAHVGALLGWDEATYMPPGGAPARGRQNALIAQRWPQVFLRDVAMPGCNHLTVCDEPANVASPLFDCALDLLRRY
jgi:Zn-dependent M32 family carboxypeptidase